MTQVNHKLFGTGTVINNDAKTVFVIFNGEVKRMVAKFANLTNQDGSVFELPKVKKSNAPKTDWSKLSDTEILAIYNEEKAKFIGAICEANADAKAEGKKGFGFIN